MSKIPLVSAFRRNTEPPRLVSGEAAARQSEWTLLLEKNDYISGAATWMGTTAKNGGNDQLIIIELFEYGLVKLVSLFILKCHGAQGEAAVTPVNTYRAPFVVFALVVECASRRIDCSR